MALEQSSRDSANSRLTNNISSSSVDTYGSYVELIASTARESYLLTVEMSNHDSGSNRSSIIQLATGAASSEVPFMTIHLPFGSVIYTTKVKFTVPFTIGSGERVSFRVKGSFGNTDVGVGITLSDDDSWGTCTQAELAGETNSEGVTIDPGGTSHTKGSWTEIISSTSHDYDLIVLTFGNNLNNIATAASWLIDIGTGAASSEVAILSDLYHSVGTFENDFVHCMPIYVPIPSGTRVSARAQCSITDATDRLFDMTILGLNLTEPSGGGGGGGGGAWGYAS